jgi:hypothetical protein
MGVGVSDTGGTQFRVIDPPRVSPDRVPPTRVTLLAMAISISLLAGLAASFVANEVMPTFPNARALREAAERPILGTVSFLPSESSKRRARRRAFLFAGGLGSLLASFGAVLALALLVGRIAQEPSVSLIEQAAKRLEELRRAGALAPDNAATAGTKAEPG